LPDDANATDRAKYSLCQNIIRYQQENKLPESKLIKKLGISKEKLIDILFSKVYNLELSELNNLTEKLGIKNIDLSNIPFSHVPSCLNSRFICVNNQQRI
jgi:hypothetical protein